MLGIIKFFGITFLIIFCVIYPIGMIYAFLKKPNHKPKINIVDAIDLINDQLEDMKKGQYICEKTIADGYNYHEIVDIVLGQYRWSNRIFSLKPIIIETPKLYVKPLASNVFKWVRLNEPIRELVEFSENGHRLYSKNFIDYSSFSEEKMINASAVWVIDNVEMFNVIKNIERAEELERRKIYKTARRAELSKQIPKSMIDDFFINQ